MTALERPKIKILDDVVFPVVEMVGANDYKLLRLPEELRSLFDEGFHAVRINSKQRAASIPDYAGRTEANYSLLPHQDHYPDDYRRFLMLSQTRDEKREAATFILLPETAEKILAKTLSYFEYHRTEIAQSSIWEPTFVISKEQFDFCMETGNLEKVIVDVLAEKSDPASKLFAYTGLLGYLIQGTHSNYLVQEAIDSYPDEFLIEKWETPGIFIFDNSRVFHGRLGGNTNILQRNWCV